MTIDLFLLVVAHALGATISPKYIQAIVQFLKEHVGAVKAHALRWALVVGFVIGVVIQLVLFYVADGQIPTNGEIAAALGVGLAVAFGAAGLYDLDKAWLAEDMIDPLDKVIRDDL
jgi:hypothetical protein